jgi:hypothetical protein
MVSRSIYNLKIDTIYMYDIQFDRSFLQLSNGIRHVMPSNDTKPELTAKASMAQPVSQPAVYANGLMNITPCRLIYRGTWGSVVVKALRYKSEGPGIDSRCRRVFFRGI